MISKKKARKFSPEFKLKIVERMLAGEGTSTLAREIKARRKLLYEWKDDYISGGPGALRTRGRPRKYRILEEKPVAETGRAELLQARKQITELERKVGHQQMQIDFFVEALRHLKAIEGKQEGRSEKNSTTLSKIKCSKVD
jgi:transposase